MRRQILFFASCVATLVAGCSDGDGASSNDAMDGGVSGATGGGGTASSTGGAGQTGGSTAAGGAIGTGGTDASGGSSATGGAPGTGGAEEDAAPPAPCPLPPSGASAEAIVALDTENAVRLAMGIPCAELINTISLAAQNHCDYFLQNQDGACEASSAHSEIDGCPGFTGTSPGARMRAAGYMERGASETMAFRGDPAFAVQIFIDSVYHRTPILNPWVRHMGYGWGDGCDTIDFGQGPATPDDVTAVYPYAGQTGLPVSFDGSREGPEPPEPATGWPSGYPVTLFARDVTVTRHAIMLDGTTDELPHLWLDDDQALPDYALVLYTDSPLAANTAYRVIIETTRAGQPLNFDWTFTTGAGGRR
jgi:hypothetical protein